MAYLSIIVSVPDKSIADLNEKVCNKADVHAAIQGAINVLEAVVSREYRSDNAYIVSRDTDPSVGTHGSSSVSKTVSQP